MLLSSKFGQKSLKGCETHANLCCQVPRESIVPIYLIDTSCDVPPGHVIPFFVHLLVALTEMGHDVHAAMSEDFKHSVLMELSALGLAHHFDQMSIIGSPQSFSEAFQLVRDDVLRHPSDRAVLFWPAWPQVDLHFIEELGASFPFPFEIITLANISNFVRRSDKISTDAKFLLRALNIPQIRTIFYWDSLETDELPSILQTKCRKIEEFHDGALTSENQEEKKLADVGFFGSSLSASRGLLEFVLLALMNPRLKFLASGGEPVWTGGLLSERVKHRWFIRKVLAVSEFVIGLLTRHLAARLRNLRFEVRHSPTQVALNDHMRGVQYVFAAGHIHPYSSGIALKSLALGIPVLWTSGNSAVANHLTTLCGDGRLQLRNFLIPNSLTSKIMEQRIQVMENQVVSWDRFKKSLASGLNLIS